jgi:2-amino-4-hydroxy-6-hydroxymethyldihydropteridine diphosphokinase
MHKIYLLLGSNIGDSVIQLENAIVHIEKKIGHVQKKSSLYATAAWGNVDQNDFINQVILVNTTLSAAKTLTQIFAIEKKMGRVRTFKNAAREIDIDILFFDAEIINTPTLTIPHKEIQNRRFVLEPLNEIASTLVHAALQQNIKTLLQNCTDTLNVQKI